MGGISGIFHHLEDTPVDQELLRRMNASLAHRGPDSSGYFFDGSAGLAVRRLAVVDVGGGDQPLSSEDGSVIVTGSGQLYNFPELRKTLEDLGHHFQTRTDAEVVVHGYEEWGDEVIDRLNGMFAFAVWDSARRRLLLARDAMGQMPLYWHASPHGIVWSSELRSLLEVPWIVPKCSSLAMHHFLSLRYVPEPMSMLEGVQRLPASHFLVIDAYQEPKLFRWWKGRFLPKLHGGKKDYLKDGKLMLEGVIRRHLYSDVSVGVLLGSGIDSALVASIAQQQLGRPVRTFSLAFPERYSDEVLYSRKVAKFLKSDHLELTFSPKNLPDLVDKATERLSDPIADPSVIAFYELARQVRQSTSVVLSGIGADETLGGYGRYRADQLCSWLMPQAAWRALLPMLVSWMPELRWLPDEQNLIVKAKHLSHALSVSDKASVLRWSHYFSQYYKLRLYTPEMRVNLQPIDTAELLERTFDTAEADGLLDRTLYVDQRFLLPGAIIPRMELMAMSHGLQVRSPFLDRQWVEWSARVPTEFKQGLGYGKILLRLLSKGRVPNEIRRKPARGFEVPISYWLRHDLHDWAYSILLGNRRLEAWFQRAEIERLFNEHYRGRRDHGYRLWAIVTLSRWLEVHNVPS